MQQRCQDVTEVRPDTFFSANPVEENLHTGMIDGLTVIKRLKEKKHFSYELAINNDYICPLYEGDSNRYIYAGAVGKLLPCFYIKGKETHVGQCFEGFDESLLAAELVKQISFNTEFCDIYEGESTLPPSVLKIKDLKEQYNVQTAFEALVYFNYFVHNKSVEEITEQLKKAAHLAWEDVLKRQNEQYQKYCEKTQDRYHRISYPVQVPTYEELYEKAKAKQSELDKKLQQIVTKEQEGNRDTREIGVCMIRYLFSITKDVNPAVVLYFAPPYCPHNTLKKEDEGEKDIRNRLCSIAQKIGQETGEKIEVKQFFPSLSDSSYLKIDDGKKSIQFLTANFPGYETLYPLPFDTIRSLNIPAVNFGVYGKDAHKWTERLYKPYSFEVLPRLIIATVEEFLSNKKYHIEGRNDYVC